MADLDLLTLSMLMAFLLDVRPREDDDDGGGGGNIIQVQGRPPPAYLFSHTSIYALLSAHAYSIS